MIEKFILSFLFILFSLGSVSQDSLYIVSLKKSILSDSDPVSMSAGMNRLIRLYADRYTRNSSEYAESLLWCSKVCCDSGDNRQSLKLLKSSSDIFRTYGTGPFSGRDTLNQLMYLSVRYHIEMNSDREYRALWLLRKLCELKKYYFGENSSEYLNSLLDLSRLYSERFCYVKSDRYHNMGYKAYINLIKEEFCSMSESERYTYWDSAIKYINKTIDLSYNNRIFRKDNLSSYAYNSLLLSKGLLLNTTVSFEKYVYSSNNAAAISSLNLKKSMQSAGAEPSIIDSIDYVIIDLLKAEGQTYSIPQLSFVWQDISSCLEENDVAIEFFKNTFNEYGALILKKGWHSPKMVKLGNYIKISGQYFTLNDIMGRHSLQDYSDTQSELWWKISKAIWTDDIVKYFPLSGEGNIYFSADGLLQVESIENLPFLNPEKEKRDDGTYYSISDLYNIYRLSSTREIVISDDYIQGKDAVVYGGLKYDMDIDSMVSGTRKHSGTGIRNVRYLIDTVSAGSRGLVMSLPELEGTMLEAKTVSSIINSAGITDLKAETYTSESGTESSFKSLSGKHKRLVHIATHGYYVSKDEIASSPFGRENPMERAILFFSGADNTLFGREIPENTDDGLLNSLEISSLDFQGLDLVVLSACETARGDISADGVFGLQRGFKMASAKSILMSLWNVDDEATKVLMTEFYRNIVSGQNKREALEKAKSYVRSIPEWNNPKYWAAFILLDGL